MIVLCYIFKIYISGLLLTYCLGLFCIFNIYFEELLKWKDINLNIHFNKYLYSIILIRAFYLLAPVMLAIESVLFFSCKVVSVSHGSLEKQN